MSVHDRVHVALQANEPGPALKALVLELSREGRTREEIYQALERFVLDFRSARTYCETKEDFILDLMDALTGACHPSAHLLAEHDAPRPPSA